MARQDSMAQGGGSAKWERHGSTLESVVVTKETSQDVSAKGGRESFGRYSWDQVFAALLYTVVSIMITFANKVVLTTYGMHSFTFLSFSQSLTAIIVLPIICKVYKLPLPTGIWSTFRKLQPLPVIAVLNAVFSLGGTERLSIPMMTVLRRFTILLTMIFEFSVLKIKPSPRVALTVGMMICGAIIAAMDDLVFSPSGYTFVLVSDVFTALNGVFNKKKLEECKEVGMHGMLFINNLFSMPVMALVCIAQGEMQEVLSSSQWGNPRFVIWFAMASVLGLCLNFSMLYCTNVNSALTTSVIGCLKNIVVTYCGMIFVEGYAYTILNFVGINISVLGSVVYSAVRYIEGRR